MLGEAEIAVRAVRRPGGRRVRSPLRRRIGTRRPSLAGLCELRPVPRLRSAGRRVPPPCRGADVKADSRLDQKLLVLVTLGLVAFGLVMVYSATSASAAVGDGDPMAFLERQAIYAFLGVVLMALASRFDYHRLRYVAPPLMLVALGYAGRAGRRAGDQRRAPLVPARPRQLPAVGARKAGALPLRRGVPRAAPTAPNARRARRSRWGC